MSKATFTFDDIIVERIFSKDPEQITEEELLLIIKWFDDNRKRFLEASQKSKSGRRKKAPVENESLKAIFGENSSTNE